MRARQKSSAISAVLLLSFFFTGIATADAPSTETQKVAAENEKTLKEQLARKLPAVRFNANALYDVIDFLRDATGTTIFVGWPALDAAGVPRDAAVTYKADEVVYADVLSAVLGKAAGDPKKLVYCTDGGVIYVSTPDGVKAFQKLWKKHAAMSTDKIPKFPAKLPDLRFNANSFSDVLDFLRDATGCKIECDWDQLKKNGIEQDAPITAKLHEIPTLMAFQFIADAASNDKGTVDFRIEGDTIKFL